MVNDEDLRMITSPKTLIL